jgi:hypothetical protein
MATPAEPAPERQIGQPNVPSGSHVPLTPNRRLPSIPLPESLAGEMSREASSRAKSGRPETSSRIARILHSVGDAAHRAGDGVENFDKKALWGAVERGFSKRAGRLAKWVRSFAEKRAQKGATRLNRIGDRIRSIVATGLRGAGSVLLRASEELQPSGNKAYQQADQGVQGETPGLSFFSAAGLTSIQGESQAADTSRPVPRTSSVSSGLSYVSAEGPTSIQGESQAADTSRPVPRTSSVSLSNLDFSAAAAAPVSGAPQQALRVSGMQDPTYSRPSAPTQQSTPKGAPSR